MDKNELCLALHSLNDAYERGVCTPEEVLGQVHRRIEQGRASGQNAWLHVRGLDELLADARAVMLRRSSGERLPLFGVPFGAKDSIDVAGMPTTVACPALARVPSDSSRVVQ